MDARIAALLKTRGLRFDPFRLTYSESDAHLPAMQIRTPLFQLQGDAPRVIYGEDGCGKTARCLRDLRQASRQYPERRALPVRFNVPLDGAPTRDVEPALAQAIAAAIFTTGLLHGPTYQPELATRLAEALDMHLDLPDWRTLLADGHTEEGLKLMYDLLGIPRPAQGIALPASWMPLAEAPARTGAPVLANDAEIIRLIDLAQAMGANSLVILADNLSAPDRTPEAMAAWAARLWSWHMRDDRVVVQLYAPLAAQSCIEAAVGQQPCAVIRWDVHTLRAMIERRLLVASNEEISDLQTLEWSEQDEQDLYEAAGGSPRQLITLIQDELARRVERDSLRPAHKSAHAPATVNQHNAGVFQRTSAEPSRQPSISVTLPPSLPKGMTGWLS